MLPEFLLQALATGTTLDKQERTIPLQWSVTLKEAQTLYDIVHAVRPSVSLELGFGMGMSTLAILAALKANGQGHHHVIDPYEYVVNNAGLAAVEAAGLTSFMTFHSKESELVIPHLPTIEFVFIDASHLFDLTMADFVLADKKLCIGGVMGFHDLWMPSYQQLLDFILTNRAYEPYNWFPRTTFPFKYRVLQQLLHSPFFRKILDPRLIQRRLTLGIPNLACIRKTALDKRKYDHHVRF